MLHEEQLLLQVTIDDFEQHFSDDVVIAFFESLEIGAMDAWTLFLSLDVDGDHTISVDEFTATWTNSLMTVVIHTKPLKLTVGIGLLVLSIEKVEQFVKNAIAPLAFFRHFF